MIVFHTIDKLIQSEPVTGYSIDNIPPYPAKNVTVSLDSENITVDWERDVEDFGGQVWYEIYRAF